MIRTLPTPIPSHESIKYVGLDPQGAECGHGKGEGDVRLKGFDAERSHALADERHSGELGGQHRHGGGAGEAKNEASEPDLFGVDQLNECEIDQPKTEHEGRHARGTFDRPASGGEEKRRQHPA